MLADALLFTPRDSKYLVCGGALAIDFLRSRTVNAQGLDCRTMGRAEFLHNLSTVKRLVTTSGSMSTLEAFALSTPTAFFPQTNLSQWKQLRFLSQVGAAPLRLEWETFVQPARDLEMLNEEDAMNELSDIESRVFDDGSIKGAFLEKLAGLFTDPIDPAGQNKFILETGCTGSSVIVDDILKLAKASGS